MYPKSAFRTLPEPTRIHPALRSFGDECGDAFIEVLAYVGVLAILAATAIYAGTHYTTLFETAAVEPELRPDFVPTPRSPPAFAVSQLDFGGKTETYQVLRHREGGRKDVLRWTRAGPAGRGRAGNLPARRRGEPGPAAAGGSRGPDRARRPARDPDRRRDRQQVRRGDAADADRPRRAGRVLPRLPQEFRAAGAAFVRLVLPGQDIPEQRAAIGCMLDRLVQLSAGNDPAIAELFARAELRRTGCPPASAGPATAENWVTATQNPRLRGSL